MQSWTPRPAWSCVSVQGSYFVSQVNAVNVEISVLLGRSILPMQQLLRMGRGAVIPLDTKTNDEVWILANNHPIARGEIQISDERIAIQVTRAADVYDYMAGGS
ncbi:FliM/FliN family flagellar motor switch protein [Caulobacter sp. BE264]|uniref:FliM/FliN family flagellar motor switch protein n=1 Tax=Caulobacter sp. BE264 TaxID=2817724 RepID=UPI00286CD530|nr:FliM/FliN family flagellar motor switch protein [Caulobacter sp. BE264]